MRSTLLSYAETCICTPAMPNTDPVFVALDFTAPCLPGTHVDIAGRGLGTQAFESSDQRQSVSLRSPWPAEPSLLRRRFLRWSAETENVRRCRTPRKSTAASPVLAPVAAP